MTRTTFSLPVALLVVPAMLVGAAAQEGPPTRAVGQAPEKKRPAIRQPRAFAQTAKTTTRQRDPNDPPWNPVIPATIPVTVRGVARDEAGKPVVGATITLYDTTLRNSKRAGQTTTDALGRYVIRDAVVPVQTSFSGHPFRKEITPYAGFILSGLAPGLGIAWSPQQSMYAV